MSSPELLEKTTTPVTFTGLTCITLKYRSELPSRPCLERIDASLNSHIVSALDRVLRGNRFTLAALFCSCGDSCGFLDGLLATDNAVPTFVESSIILELPLFLRQEGLVFGEEKYDVDRW